MVSLAAALGEAIEAESMSEIDLPWIMAKLRGLLDDYERTPFSPDWHTLIRVTYRHRETGHGVTLTVGAEPAGDDDDV